MKRGLERRLPLPGTSNVRDLGGYPAMDGHMIAYGKLYRGEALAYPGAGEVNAIYDPAHQAHFQALGLKKVVDLRSPVEAERTPSAWSAATGAHSVSIPIEEGAEGSDTNVMGRLMAREIRSFTEEDLGELYVLSLERRAKSYGRAVTVLAESVNLPALVHCAAGKDRTGILIALVLGVLGTPREFIIEDYELTGLCRPGRVQTYAGLLAELGLRPDDVRALFETPATAMVTTLDHIDKRYGSAEGYLVDAGGVPPSAIESLRASLLVRN